MKKNSEFRIQKSEVRIQNSEFRSQNSESIHLGIGTGAGIVAPPNLKFGGGAKTPIIHPLFRSEYLT